MRRLLVLPLLLGAFSFAPSASHAVPCHGVYSGNTNVGVCAGIECVDLCGPRPVVYTQCSGVPTVVYALCFAVDLDD